MLNKQPKKQFTGSLTFAKAKSPTSKAAMNTCSNTSHSETEFECIYEVSKPHNAVTHCYNICISREHNFPNIWTLSRVNEYAHTDQFRYYHGSESDFLLHSYRRGKFKLRFFTISPAHAPSRPHYKRVATLYKWNAFYSIFYTRKLTICAEWAAVMWYEVIP